MKVTKIKHILQFMDDNNTSIEFNIVKNNCQCGWTVSNEIPKEYCELVKKNSINFEKYNFDTNCIFDSEILYCNDGKLKLHFFIVFKLVSLNNPDLFLILYVPFKENNYKTCYFNFIVDGKIDKHISLSCEKIYWYKDGKLHRENGPAHSFYERTITGKITRTDEYVINGKLHREDGPAIVDSNGNETWYKNNEKHREDGPAFIKSLNEGKNEFIAEYWENGGRVFGGNSKDGFKKNEYYFGKYFGDKIVYRRFLNGKWRTIEYVDKEKNKSYI